MEKVKFEDALEDCVQRIRTGDYAIDRYVCKYRIYTSDGKTDSCAIGKFIPDSLYDPCMEGMSVRQLFYRYPEVKKLFGVDADLEKWLLLQSLHDDLAIANYRMVGRDLKDIAYYLGWKEELRW